MSSFKKQVNDVILEAQENKIKEKQERFQRLKKGIDKFFQENSQAVLEELKKRVAKDDYDFFSDFALKPYFDFYDDLQEKAIRNYTLETYGVSLRMGALSIHIVVPHGVEDAGDHDLT